MKPVNGLNFFSGTRNPFYTCNVERITLLPARTFATGTTIVGVYHEQSHRHY